MSSVTFLYHQKTSENLRFSDVFRRYKNVTLDINGLFVPLNLNKVSNFDKEV